MKDIYAAVQCGDIEDSKGASILKLMLLKRNERPNLDAELWMWDGASVFLVYDNKYPDNIRTVAAKHPIFGPSWTSVPDDVRQMVCVLDASTTLTECHTYATEIRDEETLLRNIELAVLLPLDFSEIVA